MRRLRPGAFLLLGATAIALVVDAAYATLIVTGKVPPGPRPDFVAAYMLAAVLAALGGAFASRRRFYSAVGAASALAFVGYIGIFSIGLPLLVASALATAGAIRTRDPDTDDWAITIPVILAAFLLGIGGLLATQP